MFEPGQTPEGEDGKYEWLALQAAERTLERQDEVLTELRSRTGVLLAAASIAASLLGTEGVSGARSAGLVLLALGSFVLAVAVSVYILLPKQDRFTFGLSGPGMYEGLYAIRTDLPEVYRRMAYDLDRFWGPNDRELTRLFRLYRIAAGALVLEVVLFVGVVSDTLT